jgi:hypothetical protein
VTRWIDSIGTDHELPVPYSGPADPAAVWREGYAILQLPLHGAVPAPRRQPVVPGVEATKSEGEARPFRAAGPKLDQ